MKETDLVLVEAISMFRMRYAVRVPKGMAEWAADTVAMKEANELTQKHLDETILSHRVIDWDEFNRLINEDAAYMSGWSDDVKERVLVNDISDKSFERLVVRGDEEDE